MSTGAFVAASNRLPAIESSVAVHRRGLDSRIAFFRWSVEGREGLGHYEVARTDG